MGRYVGGKYSVGNTVVWLGIVNELVVWLFSKFWEKFVEFVTLTGSVSIFGGLEISFFASIFELCIDWLTLLSFSSSDLFFSSSDLFDWLSWENFNSFFSAFIGFSSVSFSRPIKLVNIFLIIIYIIKN